MINLHKQNPDDSNLLLDFDKKPEKQEGFGVGGKAHRKHSENGIAFRSIDAEKITYADGRPEGLTMRLSMHAPGKQTYTWRTGAREHGFIGSEKDFKDFEATVCFRVHDFNKTHTSLSWIIRGGAHEGSHDARASCIGMQIPYGNPRARIFKELDHPDYDFITVGQKFDYTAKENVWVAAKIVSYLESEQNRTRNYLYLDTDPYDREGRPRNHFRLYSEWNDVDGVSTGQYSQAALWRGWVTTFRVDGWKKMDVSHLSINEI